MLVLSVRPREAFYVGDQRVELVSYSRTGVVLSSADRHFTVTSAMRPLPGSPEILIGIGARKERSVRIGIKAPEHIKVLREKLYQQANPKTPMKPPRRFFLRAVNCKLCQGRMALQKGDVWVACPARLDSSLPPCSS